MFRFRRRGLAATDHLKGLREKLEQQESQLSLALAVLSSLGFELVDFVG